MAKLSNLAYMSAASRPTLFALDDPTVTGNPIYVMRMNTAAFAFYTPLLPGSTPSQSVPQIAVFKGTDSLMNLLLDVQLFRDQTETQFNSILLESFYTDVKAFADMIGDNAEGRDIVMTGHSLGGTYALAVYARLLQDHPYVAAEVSAVETFNAYVLHDETFVYLKNAPASERSVIKHHVIESDFASVHVLDGSIGEVDKYDHPIIPLPDEQPLSTVETLRQYMQLALGNVGSAFTVNNYVTISAHSMENWTMDTPTAVYQSVPIDLGTINLMYFHTEAQAPIPQRGIAHNAPLYLAPFEKLDVAVQNADTMLARVQVPDETAFLVQAWEGEYYVNWQMLVSHEGNLSSEPVMRPIFNGRDAIGQPKVFLVSVNTGQALRIPDTTFANLSLPAALEKVALTELNADVAVGDVLRYEFVQQPHSNHSERRGSPHILFPDEATIGFTYYSQTGDLDSYDVPFYLYDTGGTLKWGHINVGDTNNYKIRLVHSSGNLYDAHSNTYQHVPFPSPRFEIAHWDTNRYVIRNTDVINSGQYLKRPTFDQWQQLQLKTIEMQKNDSSLHFLDMEWETWDGITGSPDEFLFTIEPFTNIQIPAMLGDSLTNNVNGVATTVFMVYPQYLRSSNGDYILTMERNGNLIIWEENGGARWHANTYNDGNGLVIKSDGNLVVWGGGTQYDMVSPVRWNSQTGPGNGDVVANHGHFRTAKITDDGKFQILDGSGTLIKEY